MPDFTETKEILTRYLRARVPVVVIRSMEPVRVMELLTQSAGDMGAMAYTVYSRTEGLKDLMSNQVVSDDTSLSAALEMSRQTFKTRSNVNVVFTEIDDLEQESPTSRHFAELARLAEQRQGTLIFLTDRPVWSGLSRLGMSVSLDLPTIDELTEVLEGFIEANRPTTDIEWGFDEVRQAAEILCGITETEAINVIATMLARRRLLNSELPELSQFKDRIFGDLSGLERIPLKEDYAIGGLRTLQRLAGQAGARHEGRPVADKLPPAQGSPPRRRTGVREVPLGQGRRTGMAVAPLPPRHGVGARDVRRPVRVPAP